MFRPYTMFRPYRQQRLCCAHRCADKSEAEHKETAARNKVLEDKLVGIEGVMEGAPAQDR